MDTEQWLVNGFNQSAKWQCAEVTRVDTLPCSGDYTMIGSESFLEFLNGADYDGNNLGAGSFEHLKYKLWSQLVGSDRSACQYAILEMEFNIINTPPAPPFPCPVEAGRRGRILQGQTATYYPFFAVGNVFIGGIILSPEYVLTIKSTSAPFKVAYGLQPGQMYTNVFSGPNAVDVSTTYDITTNLRILKVSPPIPFGPDVGAARISDCSGPSNPVVGDQVAFYGIGMNEFFQFQNEVKFGCGQIAEPPCFEDANTMCVLSPSAIGDLGGPIMKMGPDGYYYLVGVIYGERSSKCKISDFIIKIHFEFFLQF